MSLCRKYNPLGQPCFDSCSVKEEKGTHRTTENFDMPSTWLEKGLSLLEEEKRYSKTMEKCQKVFKVGNVEVTNSWADQWLKHVLLSSHIEEKKFPGLGGDNIFV